MTRPKGRPPGAKNASATPPAWWLKQHAQTIARGGGAGAKRALAVVALVVLALGCASAHRTAGVALRELGTAFLETATLYDRALTTGAITRAEYDRFVTFARDFQRGYESAYVVWIAGDDSTDTILRLKNELLLFALRLR